jgi:hypothetical protein
VQSLSITNKVVRSIPAGGEVFSIQHYVIKFVSVLRHVGGFSLGIPVFSTNKAVCHDIAKILLKVTFNTKD